MTEASMSCCEHVKECLGAIKHGNSFTGQADVVFSTKTVPWPWYLVEKRLVYLTTVVLLTLFVERLTGRHVAVISAVFTINI